MKIKSSAFEDGERIPSKYTCDGENMNPPLEFLEIPKQAQSLALIAFDPDAPAGPWTHWTVWNIDPEADGIREDSVPEGATEGITSAGRSGYHGPCPPSGTHRYFFRLYALDAMLDLPPKATVSELKSVMRSNEMESTELLGLYSH